jgi:predicted P-loop ATPase
MSRNKKAAEMLNSLPPEELKKEKDKAQMSLELMLQQLKDKHGVDLEPVNNTTFKLSKVIDWLNKYYDFRYNRVSLEIEYKSKDQKKFVTLEKHDLINIFVKVKLANHSIGKELFKDVVESEEVSHMFHPFEEYLFNLPVYNPDEDPDYIALYMNQVKLKDEGEREIFIDSFRRWITAAVASLTTDGISNQQCFVLVGRQGIFKTTFLNSLVPEQMQMDYLFSSKFNFENKDHYKYLATKMVVNLDELATFSRTDEGILKTILTDARVVMRLPYGAVDTKWFRKASFCGSTNNNEFLKDETGNRRFLIFEIDDIKIDKSLQIDDVYRQALYHYKNKMQYWFDQTDIAKIEVRNDQFHDVSIEQDLIEEFLQKPSEEDFGRNINFELRTATNINVFLAGKSNRINVNETTKRRIVQILRKLGFKQVQKRLNGSDKPSRLWAVKTVQRADVEGGEPVNIDSMGI